MAHPEHQQFVRGVLANHDGGRGRRVLEFGSYDVNGETRALFREPAEYVGVDHRAGPGVDVVCLFHDYRRQEPFDIFACCNTFEHDPFWEQSLANGLAHLRSGGLVILTVPHGYVEHEMGCPPTPGYYGNIPAERLLEVLRSHGLKGSVRVLTEPPECHVEMTKP